jgi:hypothetical protein
VDVYRSDFNAEREARQKIAGEKADLMDELLRLRKLDAGQHAGDRLNEAHHNQADRNARPAAGETARNLPTTNFVRETVHQVSYDSIVEIANVHSTDWVRLD